MDNEKNDPVVTNIVATKDKVTTRVLAIKRSKKAKKSKVAKKTVQKKLPKDENELYGILDEPNINYVQFGVDKRFHTWYGTNVYFENGSRDLGIVIENNLNRESPTKKEPMKKKGTSEKSKMWLDTLFVCEYCFKYTDIEQHLIEHTKICKLKNNCPPGKIKYKSPKYTIRRIKGSKHSLFCQCLCLFTKLFLDNKSMYFKVENYEFYMLYETGDNKPMGFFSKDLLSYQQNNLACILIFPPYQRRQLGTLLIEFSYKLSRLQSLITGPELPLSPFGLIGYMYYWSNLIAYEVIDGQLSNRSTISLNELSLTTGIRTSDVVMTLKHLDCLDTKNRINIQMIREWFKKQKASKKQTIDNAGNIMIEDEYLLIDD
ncbi:similar to Saccharomyces cerevisiae YMR127C SAS2 Histone acetyltransferase (HAT) catalytic subunit of the SAS complex (Sas2p-Sas4p-Sas5p) [Maudiozyma barnettii]|uniref:histone acetyltransferase n=1 Tax=Maudiozyma barnettii TaxID=61262 RepID=A0A8H2ZHF6_9SACH|nr:histone acetyltransferase [Kazachstania barnettii]CAB4254462.1 similar to Saccharomyces cerevisiae YMR127C SAS2 Histone acetyltransferase (HAT) catalytic subunit of the SAS complex (Sas2p-Sas4p-Sas5p) [Kazachstania barnettii]CAD1782435.1 similar to Saccharomyces cerevisiae YMR127C SAS2 Histone acetyltransferase (HAT) catalytic subunit of the SAS complex (Sas2p-Sas4p-Sas5p) [Kazachstania barnettii]